MYGFSIGGNRLLDRHDGAKFGKLHLDQLERLIGYPLVGGRDRRNRIADIADLFARERLLVLAHRQDAELDGEVVAGQDRQHTGQRASPAGVHAHDTRVWVRAAEDAPEEHPGQREVIGKPGLPAHFGESVGLGQRLADDSELVSHAACLSTPPARRPRRS